LILSAGAMPHGLLLCSIFSKRFNSSSGNFDSRNKQVTLAIAQLLNNSGISWGILGKEEKCCGDSLRRLGNEYVFDKQAKENVTLLKNKGVK